MKKYLVLCGVLVLLTALVAGCGGGAVEGDTVSVHYTGTLDDGTVFDSSVGGDPLTFVIGDGSMIVGFDEAVRGMNVGDVKTVTIPAEEAYGEYQEDLVVVLDRDELDDTIEVGQSVYLQNSETGEIATFIITGITDTQVVFDGNAELAGEDLTFEIEMVSIVKAGEEVAAEESSEEGAEEAAEEEAAEESSEESAEESAEEESVEEESTE